MNKRFLNYILFVTLALTFINSCATRRKLMNLVNATDSTANVQLALAKEADYLPEMKNDLNATRDTLTVKDDDGREFLLMKECKNNNKY